MSTDAVALEEPADPKCWEKRSAQILGAIRGFVDGLRSAPGLISSSSSHDSRNSSGELSLFVHLQSIGVLNQVEALQQTKEAQSTEAEPDETPIGSLLQNNYEADERKQILHRIIFPLLQNLEQCYDVLDKLPQQAQPTDIANNNSQSNSTNKKNRKDKAPPPPGMLSLNDYTNVACLLEFAISISLVPCLEYPNAHLPSLQPQSTTNANKLTIPPMDLQIHKINKDTTSCIMALRRNQALPKSLAGRISKPALTWGSICTAKNHDLVHDQLSALCTEQSQNTDQQTLHQLYHTHNIFQAYNELTVLATAIGHLLLLDRFRPMLLPRHLSDVYLILLIAERLRWYLSRLDKNIPSDMAKDRMLATLVKREKAKEKSNCERLWSLQKALLLSPLVFPSSFISTPIPNSTTAIHNLVDCREAALAYRTLLGGGASMIGPNNNLFIPPWLRLRLGQCLTKIAQIDLLSVVEVFVAHARGPGGGTDQSDNNGSMDDDIMTGAAARLARALCAEPTSGTRRMPSENNALSAFQETLCSQFVDFLVAEGEAFMTELKANNNKGLARSRLSMAMHLSLWATITQLPFESLQTVFISKLMSGLIPAETASTKTSTHRSLSATQSTAAIAAWLFTIPSSLDPTTKKKIQSFLLTPFIDNQLSMVGQFLRMVASLSEDDTASSKSTLIVEVNTQDGNDKVLSRLAEMTISQMIHILSKIYSPVRQHDNGRSASVALGLLKAISSNRLDSEGHFFTHMEWNGRGKNLVYAKIVTGADTQIEHTHLIEGVQGRAKCLVKAISSLPTMEDDSTADCIVTSTLFRLALFLHFSSCHGTSTVVQSKAQILGFKEIMTSKTDELKMDATILLAVLCEECEPASLLGSGQDPTESDTGVLPLLGVIIDSAAGCIVDDDTINAEDDESEELFSTASIVLSLLIALLELGAEKRRESDETFFESLLPSLQTLSSGGASPELAEMASHAMALIAARGAMAGEEVVQKPKAVIKKSRLELILDKLSQAETDLQSTQPPFRAKGVVLLRHIARSLVHEGGTSIGEDPSRTELLPQQEEQAGLVTEMKSGVPAKLSEKDELALISRTLARICLEALADSESYVYLASIQTLVAISDVCPTEIMPLMGSIVAKGVVTIEVIHPDSNVTSGELSLTPEQRIKATEALIFMIRRRGDGIFAYGPSLLEMMLYGQIRAEGQSVANNMLNDGAPYSIQSETYSYFTRDESTSTAGTDIQNESARDEKKIRLNTGGPVFSMEETDVLRSGAISVVCELVSVLDPAIVASFCHVLVRLATDALQLDASRPVRRLAASLARDLYACTMKEVTSQNGSTRECSSTMAVAIMNTSEQIMFDTLSRCASANDTPVNGKSRLVDISTQSRCAEAIEIRLELEAMGVLQAAALIAHSLEEESKDQNVQAIRRALSKSSM